MNAMSGMIATRTATVEDHDNLVKLAKTSKYTKDFSNAVMFSSPAAYAKGWIKLVENERREVLALSCVRHKSREPKTMLYFLVVAEECRGKNIASQLLDTVMASSPHKIMQLNVMKDNEALKFYQKLGFAIVGEAMGGTAYALEKEYV